MAIPNASQMTLPGQPQTEKQTALQKLAQNMPVANQRVATGIQAARDLQLQQAVAGAGAVPASVQSAAAQQIGAATSAQAGQQLVAAAGREAERQVQIGQLGQAETARVADLRLGRQNVASQAEQTQLANRLAEVDERAKQEIFDRRLQFNQDEAGRKFMNERQLADWAIMKAKSEEDWRNYEQQVDQITRRRLSLMEVAHKRILQKLEQDYKSGKQKLDTEQSKRLRAAADALQKRINKEKENAAKRKAYHTTMGTIAGTVIGAVVTGGNPAGAAAGATVGSAVGGYIGSREESEQFTPGWAGGTSKQPI